MRALSLEELGKLTGGRVECGSEIVVRCVRPLDMVAPFCICPLLRPDGLVPLGELPAAVLCPENRVDLALRFGVAGILAHGEPALALARIVAALHPEPAPQSGVHPQAIVHPTAALGAGVFVGAGAVIEEEASVGPDTWIGPLVYIGPGTRIGARVRIGPGAVIGFEGFGYAPSKQGPVRIRHIGIVEIADDVHIGANTCVDRATLGVTRIGPGAKLDNLIQVGHNATIGARALLAAQVGLAGSTRVGDEAMLGGQAGVADHVRIGKRAMVAAKSGVTRHVPDGAQVAGYPAWPRQKWQRVMAYLSRLGRCEQEDDGNNREGAT
ncbi:MAG: UDP-3-O-(3-hydroxymyristoyl)glucosamine N-acyltransferase [Myxococcota bacterium]|jgi:UDP-3-O-[3-hydroxymyristoyl] glucosamine N-acyltransferase|nr:UDP-3-O-(3-hydroxymyristoyl)glucosamine N-acyltransferase [Myxococcota bacterium]